MIVRKDNEQVVDPVALAAKSTLMSALPYLLPPENVQRSLHLFILEQGDFDIHNTSTTKDRTDQPLVTSLYDRKTGCIVPALLSHPLVAVSSVDIITDEEARPALTRVPKYPTPANLAQYTLWAEQYIKVRHSPPRRV
jgi:hypothetical protein